MALNNDDSEKDELCAVCAKVDLFSLFTGPRTCSTIDAPTRIILTTIQQVKRNIRCPLCRMVKHNIYGNGKLHPWVGLGEEHNPALVRCSLEPTRAGCDLVTEYQNNETADMLATQVHIGLSGIPGCSLDLARKIRIRGSGFGFQLLSPDSVHPARPLLNGFRATNTRNSLTLLSQWISACEKNHKGICQLDPAKHDFGLDQIQVIDVQERRLVDQNPTAITYAALSYVWSQHRDVYSKLTNELRVQQHEHGESVFLPEVIPKAIEDALFVCKALSIPYLWVDLYCIHQKDPVRKAAEIRSMGFLYLYSHITLVAGGSAGRLISEPTSDDHLSNQRVETIGDRKYISARPSLWSQIRDSKWSSRGWTFQEGVMSRRVAFFGDYDVSFICGSGHWRETLHSGQFGHDANISGLDLRSEGKRLTSALGWLRSARWDYQQYVSIVCTFAGRTLSYESDKLDAVSGCLNVLGQAQGVKFFSGLPSADFHYALLWERGRDLPRVGFPSWSWVGWRCADDQGHRSGVTSYNFVPLEDSSGSLRSDGNGNFVYFEQDAPDIEIRGFLLPSKEDGMREIKKCSQRLASISLSESAATVTIKSEVARFSVDIRAAHFKKRIWRLDGPDIPPHIDTCSDPIMTGLDPEVQYDSAPGRIRLRDSSGNTYEEGDVLRWHDANMINSPVELLLLPRSLLGSTLTWLVRDGIELIRIVEIKILEEVETKGTTHWVFCLGVDRREGVPGRARRMGMFCIPKEAWDKAKPEPMEVTFA